MWPCYSVWHRCSVGQIVGFVHPSAISCLNCCSWRIRRSISSSLVISLASIWNTASVAIQFCTIPYFISQQIFRYDLVINISMFFLLPLKSLLPVPLSSPTRLTWSPSPGSSLPAPYQSGNSMPDWSFCHYTEGFPLPSFWSLCPLKPLPYSIFND